VVNILSRSTYKLDIYFPTARALFRLHIQYRSGPVPSKDARPADISVESSTLPCSCTLCPHRKVAFVCLHVLSQALNQGCGYLTALQILSRCQLYPRAAVKPVSELIIRILLTHESTPISQDFALEVRRIQNRGSGATCRSTSTSERDFESQTLPRVSPACSKIQPTSGIHEMFYTQFG